MKAKIVTGVLAAAALAVTTGSASATASYWVRMAGHFSPPNAFVASSALTYDKALVPPASSIEVSQHGTDSSGMTVSMRVRGLVPGHKYGAHVHQKSCGADPEAAGGHYQNVVDPKRVTAENELWLDFTADAKGSGSAKVHKSWGLRHGGAGSIVIHDKPGASGDRVACFSVPFTSIS
ncbi:superoxide dismutase family protein [Streptomyces sp. NBC_00006]|uniref:superoxide dismutase family protein n=1 Tax=Streptomyces sp. NBC_00006 TaxID=2975619 RepID=UPI00224D2AA3|nr:superoxide dismutase family protein [Streptomyces sp. NBC_00006]MCX5533807.1 superoxide dismutase family protein [Streptomyces sp. NBC_00006]